MFMMHSKILFKKVFPRDFEAISVIYINKFIPKLILPALSIGIFLEYFFIKFSSFLEKPVVPITTLFFSLEATFKTSNVHFGNCKIYYYISIFKCFF